ncbi:MAG: SGNH/GDSL hydrolase family protein [Verrucomicrobiaceae bacterium]|nr:SGNH/GDSL hydrolase family protein [Verrucomicrobiaceae bacterium]
MIHLVRFALALVSIASASAASLEELPEHVLRGGLPNVFSKLQKGGEVHVAYLGGSITAQPGYRVKTFGWFGKEHPQAKLVEINAAIGGTGSDLGVFRVGQDVLAHKPDLMFVEFAVNDGGAAPEQIHRCMEGIVRQTWRANPETDICFVYTIANTMIDEWKAGKLPRSVAAMEQLADHYQIPSIHFGLPIAKLAAADRLIIDKPLPKTDEEKKAVGDKVVFAPDKVHPHVETGHQIYFETAVRAFEKLRTGGKPALHGLKAAFVADNLEHAKLVPLSRAKLGAGWNKLPADHKLKGFFNRLPEIWQANEPGDSIDFKFRGTSAGIYDLLGPDCGQVKVTLDGRAADKPTSRFDSYCTYHRLGSFFPARNLPDGEHTVHLEIHPDQADKAKIITDKKAYAADPKRFDDRQWYAGALMLVGDLVE